jgi:hypothetical protein
MLTGTPLDLTPFGGLVAALGWLYWIVAAGIVLLLWRAGKTLARKLVFAGMAAALLAAPLIASQLQRIEAKNRLDRATAHFEMRCKSAGEFVKRTVENVEGVVWMKWRDKRGVNDRFDQFKLFDPFGRDCEQEGCIEQLLMLPDQGGRFGREVQQRRARYQWVEAVDPADGKIYRYSGVMKPVPSWTPAAIEAHRKSTGKDIEDYSYWFKTDRQLVERFEARYGITWDDISTTDDREHWIAGGSLKVIDLQTNEVIAERIGYMMDRGLGSQAGFRIPWSLAQQYACPAFRQIGPTDPRRTRSYMETVDFVTSILRNKGEK